MIVVSQNFSLNVWTHPEVVELREDDYQQFTVSQAPRDKNCFQEHRTHRSRSGRKTIRLNESLHHISRVSTCSEQLQSWGAKSGVLGAETSSPGGWSQLSWGLKPAVLGAKASSPGGQSQRSWGPKPGVLRAKVRSPGGQSQIVTQMWWAVHCLEKSVCLCETYVYVYVILIHRFSLVVRTK